MCECDRYSQRNPTMKQVLQFIVCKLCKRSDLYRCAYVEMCLFVSSRVDKKCKCELYGDMCVSAIVFAGVCQLEMGPDSLLRHMKHTLGLVSDFYP